MSSQRPPSQSSFGRRSAPVVKLTFFDRHYRALHHIGVVVGLSLFFGPFIYRLFNTPPLEEAQKNYRPGAPRPDYARIEKELDKWR